MPVSWSFGGDPEYFLRRGSKIVPAHTVFGSKKEPSGAHTGSGLIYRDGYAVELNPKPSHCREVFANNHARLKRYAALRAKERGLTLVARSAVKIDLATLKGAPEDVLRFGCDASNCAYDFVEKRPQPEIGHQYRYGGGHLHLGAFTGTAVKDWRSATGDPVWMKDDETAALFIKMCDLKIGYPLTYVYHHKDQFLRRRMYGQAGEFRFQPYNATTFGLEYRTPPAEAWLCTPVLSYSLGMMKHLAMNFEGYKRRWDPGVEGDLREAINVGAAVPGLFKRSTTENISSVPLFMKLRDYAHSRTGRTFHGGRSGWQWFQHRVSKKGWDGVRKGI